MSKLTQEQIEEIIRRHRDGESHRQIAKAVGVGRTTVTYRLQRWRQFSRKSIPRKGSQRALPQGKGQWRKNESVRRMVEFAVIEESKKNGGVYPPAKVVQERLRREMKVDVSIGRIYRMIRQSPAIATLGLAPAVGRPRVTTTAAEQEAQQLA